MEKYLKLKTVMHVTLVICAFLDSASAFGMAAQNSAQFRRLLQGSLYALTCPRMQSPDPREKEQDPSLIGTSPYERVKLVFHFPSLASTFSNEEIGILSQENFYKRRKISAFLKISRAILAKKPSQERDIFAHNAVGYLPKKDQAAWLKALEKEKYNPLQERMANGPIFSEDTDKIGRGAKLAQLTAPSLYPNFDALLPVIADYVEGEYKQNRFVLFHGQSPEMILRQKIYHALYNETHTTKAPYNFVHLRQTDHASLKKEQLEQLHEKGTSLDLEHKPLLFTNTLLFKNEWNRSKFGSRDSWFFAAKGLSLSHVPSLDKIFADAGFAEEYAQLVEKKPELFHKLLRLYNEAIAEQGEHGQLVVISMPKKMAEELVYYGDSIGRRQHGFAPKDINDLPDYGKIFIKKILEWHKERLQVGENPVTDAENKKIHLLPFDHELCLPLIEEFINPEAAEKAGVKIVGFDPTFYWETEKAKKFEAKLQEVVRELKALRKKTTWSIF